MTWRNVIFFQAGKAETWTSDFPEDTATVIAPEPALLQGVCIFQKQTAIETGRLCPKQRGDI